MVDDRKQGGEELHHTQEKPKSAIAAREEEILEFWNTHGTFEKSLNKSSPKGEYVFYDGPPFASGLPHYGHLLQSAIKDAIPRYRTMQGYHVPRVWGWDCHGLPVENLVEKELGFKNKRDIEEYGIEKFNEAARASVMKEVVNWKRIIPRLGRWVDMEHDYKTMDPTYTESVWWAFKNLYSRGLIYEGFKAMHYCPRCGTTLSNNEVALGYQDIDDWSVYVKLPLVDESNTSLLIWTTTPWTLPGNTAAAVNKDATYVKVKVGDEYLIVAKELLGKLFEKSPGGGAPSGAEPDGGKDFLREVSQEFLGKELIGKRYEPPFDYFKNELHKHKTHAWKVYHAPYVTMEDGTGIVHLAPAYGAEDLELAQKEKIPLIHHVTDEGKFIATVTDFVGLPVKPKGHHMDTDVKVIENLERRGLLFKAEKIKHSYPHCWRCDTPLLNWAANSWFVKVSSLKNKLLSENAKISWVPEHVGKGRFKNGLESAPDWAISRSRYWGAPLPVWRHSKTKEIKVVGSVDELLGMARKSGNNYFVMRHGEARNNTEAFTDCLGQMDNHLTDRGRAQVEATAAHIKNKNIDLIITSPLPRTQESAALVQKALGLPDSAVMIDERLRETNFGELNDKPLQEYRGFYSSFKERLYKAPVGGENYVDIRRRVGEFLFEIERRYSGKNVLIVMHGGPAYVLSGVARRVPLEQMMEREDDENFMRNAEARELAFTPYPHNADYELDVHRPYIDDVAMGDSLSGEWKRVPDVFDCWFESGSMPYASNHYPFKKQKFNPKRLFGLMPKGYPADFIGEALDQTRGWFYSLIVLGVGLFNRAPYKQVITTGLILAQDGQKMSKRLKNYPDPMDVVEKYGADALRYYLLSSSVIRGEDLRFIERGVEDVTKKLLMRLDNVRSFYDLYADSVGVHVQHVSAPHVLDRWILSRLGELIEQTTAGFEKYELDVATRPLNDFVDDLSTWYLRRSRDRFKNESEDKEHALATLRHVLMTVAHVMAPVMPFYAEYLYSQMKQEGDPESVHLSTWPEARAIDLSLITKMQEVRTLSSQALQLREKAGIKIRQPLAKLAVRRLVIEPELQDIVASEINVKEIIEDVSLEQEVWLDTVLTPELKEEGMMRDLVRKIQEWRKEQGMQIAGRPLYILQASAEEKKIAEKYRSEIIAQTGLSNLTIE